MSGDAHAFANKSMRTHFAASANARIFLDLHKGADLGFIADFATVEIHKIRDQNAVA